MKTFDWNDDLPHLATGEQEEGFHLLYNGHVYLIPDWPCDDPYAGMSILQRRALRGIVAPRTLASVSAIRRGLVPHLARQTRQVLAAGLVAEGGMSKMKAVAISLL